MFEEVRFLLNFKMDSQSPMALILAGQSELWDLLRLQSYAAIRQRIDIQFQLGHLDPDLVAEYVSRHLGYAGLNNPYFLMGRLAKSIGSLVLMPQGSSINSAHMVNSRRIIDDHMFKQVIPG